MRFHSDIDRRRGNPRTGTASIRGLSHRRFAFVAVAALLAALVGASAGGFATHLRADEHFVELRIWSIEPSFDAIVADPSDRVTLAVDVLDADGNNLNDEVDELPHDLLLFRWIGPGDFDEVDGTRGVRRSGRPDDRTVEFEVPRNPGVYTVIAGLTEPNLCGTIPRLEGCSARGSAAFSIRVNSRRGPLVTAVPYQDPTGDIPAEIVDASGNAYSVVLPTSGGGHSADSASVSIPAFAIRSDSYLGVRVSRVQPATGFSRAGNGLTLGGEWVQVELADSEGAAILDYRLREPGSVCVPMPDEFRSRFTDAVVVEGLGQQRLLTSRARFDPEHGYRICGAVSSLPGIFAPAIRGVLVPTEFPPQGPQEPDVRRLSVGGYAPTGAVAAWGLVLVLVLGAAALAAGLGVAARRGVWRG